MQHIETGTWRWKVEPGMEDAFYDLQSWLLSSQRDAEIETTDATARLSAGNSPFQSCCRRPLRSPCCVWAT